MADTTLNKKSRKKFQDPNCDPDQTTLDLHLKIEIIPFRLPKCQHI